VGVPAFHLLRIRVVEQVAVEAQGVCQLCRKLSSEGALVSPGAGPASVQYHLLLVLIKNLAQAQAQAFPAVVAHEAAGEADGQLVRILDAVTAREARGA